jgi:hypothetical protein
MDPGLRGGIAVVGENAEILMTMAMPVNVSKGKRKINFSTIAGKLKEFDPDLTVIERVHARPNQGVTSMFTFGYGLGGLVGVVSALGFPYTMELPGEWQGKILKSIDKKMGKERSVIYCNQRYPEAGVKDDGIADAICLALFARHLVMVDKSFTIKDGE